MILRNPTVVLFLVIGCMVFTAGCCVKTKAFPKSTPILKSLKSAQVSQQGSSSQAPEEIDLALRGVGVKNILFVKTLSAGFYLPAELNSKDALDTRVPKVLSVVFYIKFSAQDFANYTIEHMKPNLTREEFQSLEAGLKRMREISPNINAGDNFTLSYRPNEGTTFIHNGVVKGTIEGALFARAIFSTWIGPTPIDEVLKKEILGLLP